MLVFNSFGLGPEVSFPKSAVMESEELWNGRTPESDSLIYLPFEESSSCSNNSRDRKLLTPRQPVA